MAKLPYGFDANPMYQTVMPQDAAEAWDRLHDIQLSLEKREAVAPELAAWLGEAIEHAKRDPDELMRRLGLKKGRGKPAADPNAWLTVGKRICELEDFGLNPDEVRAAHLVKDRWGNAIGEIPYERMKPEAALNQVSAETFGSFERSQLQKFRDAYRAAWRVVLNGLQ